jgi:hypothetical protein
MAIMLVFLLITFLLFGAGFTLHILWWIAAIALAVWLIGLIVGRTGGGRWYRW